MSRNQRKKTQPWIALAIAVAAVLLLIFGNAESLLDSLYSASGVSARPVQTAEGTLSVHFIDVGQADCTLIKAPGKNVLIDAGERDSAPVICDYLRAQGVERIDILIATHPHADHIGGMAEVVESFEIGKVIFSDVPDRLIPTTKTYERLLDAIAEKGLRITKAKPETVYDLGDGAALTILGPLNRDQNDLNDTSVVCRLDFGANAFLFTGDAEKASENELLDTYGSEGLCADVLKLGHHGSHSSTQDSFLNAVGPTVAVACVGTDNSYGHPHAETVKRLEQRDITFYRTDLNGTVVILSDGQTLDVRTEK